MHLQKEVGGWRERVLRDEEENEESGKEDEERIIVLRLRDSFRECRRE